ncbi:3-methyladenine DNA glycosylase [Yimella sp. cx-573]|nr:3-methyladenine DNA glycosylase [Yimella sp. cx-573]
MPCRVDRTNLCRVVIELEEAQWRVTAASYTARVDSLLADHIHRRDRGIKHPIDDFLFEYYHLKPSHLRVWHPGAGVLLRGGTERTGWRFYRPALAGAQVDLDEFRARRSGVIRSAHAVLRATIDRPMQLSCFGMHEWAMAYRTAPEQMRHTQLPLRLGHAGTDTVVEAHELRCTHFDAYRFFTDDATPRNNAVLHRSSQADFEQPGCLHAGMDLYRWAYSLSPVMPSELLLRCFELARDIRVLDMRASPYDVTSLGHAPVAVETSEGKAEYVRQQREFAGRAPILRASLLEVCRAAMPAAQE